MKSSFIAFLTLAFSLLLAVQTVFADVIAPIPPAKSLGMLLFLGSLVFIVVAISFFLILWIRNKNNVSK